MGERVLSGIAASRGIAIGPAYVPAAAAIGARQAGSPQDELTALDRALGCARADIAALIAGQDTLAAEILAFQEALLDDEEMLQPAYAAIAEGRQADHAWTEMMDREIADYRTGGDDLLSGRASDLQDLKDRVLRALRGQVGSPEDVAPQGAILLADDITPSGFLQQDWNRLAGAAICGGSPTSHVSILASARGIPLVVELDAKAAALAPEGPIVLDAERGRVILSPSAETLSHMADRLKIQAAEDQTADTLLHEPAITADGQTIRVLVNVDDPQRLTEVDPAICDGIGLTRTEFLFAGDRLPDEATQLAAYRGLLDWADGRPVTIRTLDAGGDKPIPGVTPTNESNPFLGLRGLRLSLATPQVFRVQLRALVRAAAHGPLKVMAPMVTEPEEMWRFRALVDAVVGELEREGKSYARPPLGMMIEVPAAALTADTFDADFYSIGSNDLVQYTTAAARDTPSVAALARPDNPAVLEMLRRTVDAATARAVEVSLCGDMASNPKMIGPLLSAGLRTLSVAPAQVGRVKLAIRGWSQMS